MNSHTHFSISPTDHYINTTYSDPVEIERNLYLRTGEFIRNRLLADEQIDTGYYGLLMLSVVASINLTYGQSLPMHIHDSEVSSNVAGLNCKQIATFKTNSSILCKEQPILDMHKECTICHETIEQRTMLQCNHAFHFNCILKWMNTGARSCPTCRAAIVCD